VINPRSGWAYNSNNYPYSAAGPDSPKRSDYPLYMDPGSENARGIHAVRLLKDKKDFTLNTHVTRRTTATSRRSRGRSPRW
jgi:acyl-homoserine-lactone acylase